MSFLERGTRPRPLGFNPDCEEYRLGGEDSGREGHQKQREATPQGGRVPQGHPERVGGQDRDFGRSGQTSRTGPTKAAQRKKVNTTGSKSGAKNGSDGRLSRPAMLV